MLELFVTSHCPGCGEAILMLQRFCAGRDDVKLIKRDVAAARTQISSYRLFATPALVIDGRHVVYGVPSMASLERHCGPRRGDG